VLNAKEAVGGFLWVSTILERHRLEALAKAKAFAMTVVNGGTQRKCCVADLLPGRTPQRLRAGLQRIHDLKRHDACSRWCTLAQTRGEALAQTLGELDATQVRQLLTAHHLGRLTCHTGDRRRVLAVTYRISDAEHIDIDTSDETCTGLARERAPVRFEVDDVMGPSRWSTVIGWGFFEEAIPQHENTATYRIRVTGLRGFYRGAQPVLAH
jgi:hypothetical protein